MDGSAIGARVGEGGAGVSTETVVASVRDAAGANERLRISGAGGWMTAGRPVQALRAVSLAPDKGIVDYVPDDLTITVRAGTSLADIFAATRVNNQWLPLDPPGASMSTIGATIATASSGPLAHGAGYARDFILGVELVTGKGDVVRSGGRVVKNVAGFDLMRLMCGSWGTLAVITEATLRLYAMPRVDRTFALRAPGGANGIEKLAAELRAAPLAALSMELVNATLARKVGLDADNFILVRLGGNENVVGVQMKTLAGMGEIVETDGVIWDKLSEAVSQPATFSLRLSGLPTAIGGLWSAAEQLAGNDGQTHSTFSRGIVRVTSNVVPDAAAIPRPTASQRVTYEVLPAQLWQSISPSVVGSRLSENVHDAYDPHRLLNPGILG
ncbi:MAG: FAD-binding protein [Gemmatimonadaceae bacterium]|nr:FAD-binding protein [Gemmatimonadaceae bacterium]